MGYNKTNYEYSVTNYDQDWPKRFETIKTKLSEIFGPKILRIEHIGSTSVPEMKAKPTIDILVELSEISDLTHETQEMEKLGYTRFDNYIAPNSLLFMDGSGKERTEIIHIFPEGHPDISDKLGLRDFLRTHPDEVSQYENIKTDLASRFPDDYISYRKFKDEFVQNLLKRVREWQNSISTKASSK